MQASVAVLLCTFNGVQFLPEQLSSFAGQTHGNWQLFVSDDGSSDGTLELLAHHQEKWGGDRIHVTHGPQCGFVANFLSLACDPSISADYFSFADQDDVWLDDKLERAVHWLKGIPAEIPALYCSRTQLVTADNKELGLSPLFARAPAFANALMQNIGGGNTMVINRAARALLIKAGAQLTVVAHDWWVYLLVSGSGGRVFYDPQPTLRYRQHDGNLVGMNAGLTARLRRFVMLWRGNFRDWNDRNIAALETVRELLTPGNRELMDMFSTARKKSLIPRLCGFHQARIHRQTRMDNLGLLVAALFGRI